MIDRYLAWQDSDEYWDAQIALYRPLAMQAGLGMMIEGNRKLAAR